jgi:two-component system nitrogen regulation sensor histidine kinase NtrY
MADTKKKGSRFIAAIIIFLIILFFTIEFIMREAQEFSPTSFTKILLNSLQIIVLLMFLILLFVLGRNLAKLYLERKRKVIGAHFKTRLLLFFIALSLIPTLLLFFFASDLISRNIETWFKTPIDRILDDTKGLTDGFYINGEETTLHYAKQLSTAIQKQALIDLDRRLPLMEFVRNKLTEYKLDEIGVYVADEELFTYLNPDLPFQYYRDVKTNLVKRARLGEPIKSIDPMGNGEMIRGGISFNMPGGENVLVVAGKFLPQNYAEKINNISAYVQRYSQLKIQKNPVKAFYFITLIFITLLIIFAASWIGFHIARGITVPIEKLAHATKEVSKGNLNVRVEDPASDELGILIDSFNQMISDLNDSQHNIAQKTAELEGRKQYIETVLNNITTGVITLDAKGILTTINPTARDMLGLKQRNLIGKGYKEILNDDNYGEIIETIERGFKKKHKIPDKEININFDSQNVTLALTLSPLGEPNSEFSGMIVVLDNLTQLIKAQKISAWKEIAQRVAHEIKNPLTPIQLSAERIIKNLKVNKNRSNEIIEEGANTIVQEARTIKSLVDEFSNFARMPSIRLQSADLHLIIEQTISLFTGIFSDLEFKTEFSPEVPTPLLIDPDQMRRVFINLIDNAIDAMNKKGEIRISTSFEKAQQRVSIVIADFGPGIPQKERDRLFHPHYSTKKKGTGLGLAIVNQVVSEHNGSIEVETNKPQGAKFIIQIPT